MRYLWIIAFLEGIAVMAVELLGAKLIIPYYGSSTVVWTSVLGITLISLSIGYYIGAGLSRNQKRHRQMLFYILLIVALIIATLPVLATKIIIFVDFLLEDRARIRLYGGTLLSGMLILGPALVLLGTTTPILIQMLRPVKNASGNAAGRIYGISTIGGIVTALLLGFIIIPNWGIAIPLYILACIVFVFVIFLRAKLSNLIEVSVFIGIAALFFYQDRLVEKEVDGVSELIHSSEGMLGQVRVFNSVYDGDECIILNVNGINQNFINIDTPYQSYWNYAHAITYLSTFGKNGDHVLLLGLAGGSVAKELYRLGFQIDAVDIDKRMYPLAQKFFHLDAPIKSIVDDARHYVNVTQKKYNLVVMDMLNAEVQPTYLFSLESLKQIHRILSDSGALIINFQSYLYPEGIQVVPSINKTLKLAGFNPQTFHYDSEFVEDILWLATKQKASGIDDLDWSRLDLCCKENRFVIDMHADSMNGISYTKNGIVIVDNLPVLDYINARTIIEWRLNMINEIRTDLKSGIDLYN